MHGIDHALSAGTKLMTEPPIVGGEATTSHQPVKDPAFKGRNISSNLHCMTVSRSMPKKISIEIFVQEMFLGVAANTRVSFHGSKGDGLQVRIEQGKLSTCMRRKTGNKGERDAGSQDRSHLRIGSSGVGEESKKAISKRRITKPTIKPKKQYKHHFQG